MARRSRKGRGSWRLVGLAAVLLACVSAVCRPSPAPTDEARAGDSPVAPEAAVVRAFAWNVNRGVGAVPDASLDEIVAMLQRAGENDVWAFSEVDPSWFDEIDAALERASGGAVEGRLGESGRLQRLAMFWRSDRFDAIEVSELGRVNADGHGRAPIAALLRDRRDSSETLWVAVHFRRANAEARREEAAVLAALLAELALPTVVLGDANMDCPLDGGSCDPAHADLVGNGFLRWVAPSVPAATSCRSERGDMLDLVFVGGLAADRLGDTTVLDRAAWCSAGMGGGSHVPISFSLSARAN